MSLWKLDTDLCPLANHMPVDVLMCAFTKGHTPMSHCNAWMYYIRFLEGDSLEENMELWHLVHKCYKLTNWLYSNGHAEELITNFKHLWTRWLSSMFSSSESHYRNLIAGLLDGTDQPIDQLIKLLVCSYKAAQLQFKKKLHRETSVIRQVLFLPDPRHDSGSLWALWHTASVHLLLFEFLWMLDSPVGMYFREMEKKNIKRSRQLNASLQVTYM